MVASDTAEGPRTLRPVDRVVAASGQVRSVTAALAGDPETADHVELLSPEAGVCSGMDGQGRDLPAAEAAAAYCGGPAPAGIDACNSPAPRP